MEPLTQDPTARVRVQLERQLELLDRLRHEDVDELLSTHGWVYSPPSDLSDDEKRAAALQWLARHARALAKLNGKVVKHSSDIYFGVALEGEALGLIALVPANLTCEMVPTGEVEHVPAKDVPVMRKVCPPSIFAGIADEVLPESDDDSEPTNRWDALGVDTIEERGEHLGVRP